MPSLIRSLRSQDAIELLVSPRITPTTLFAFLQALERFYQGCGGDNIKVEIVPF